MELFKDDISEEMRKALASVIYSSRALRCGKVNYVGGGVRCFSDNSKVKEVKSFSEFQELTQKSALFVDFYADWCGPCKMISPEFNKLAEIHSSPTVDFIKVNVDELMEVAQQEHIRAMPTFIAYKAGSRVGEVVGADLAGLKTLVETHK